MDNKSRIAGGSACRTLVAAGAVYDLAVIGPLATPWTARPQLEIMNAVNDALEFSGTMPVFLPVHILFINLFGTFVLLWALARLFFFRQAFATADLVIRVCVSAILFWYALEGNVNGIVKLFFAVELVIAALDYSAMRIALREQLARIKV
jgi:hypothetical protein